MISGEQQLRRVVVLHGYRANPHSHWFDWLADRLRPHGIDTQVAAFPDSASPVRDAWIETAIETIGRPDPQSLVVGHSLGVVTGLHALDQLDADWELGGFVAIAGFVTPLETITSLAPFTDRVPDLARTVARTRRRLSILSDDDDIVIPAHSVHLSGLLGGDEIVVPGGRHFLGIEGWTELPVLAEWIVGRPAAE